MVSTERKEQCLFFKGKAAKQIDKIFSIPCNPKPILKKEREKIVGFINDRDKMRARKRKEEYNGK